ncbi:hypothetical protein SS05631_c16390 [Sinorhizobium sp. CCBAU 05631]|nr:hypothetical protein SS05631_c16390 [Sinorhizobium sp. CCBAU 05631]
MYIPVNRRDRPTKGDGLLAGAACPFHLFGRFFVPLGRIPAPQTLAFK